MALARKAPGRSTSGIEARRNSRPAPGSAKRRRSVAAGMRAARRPDWRASRENSRPTTGIVVSAVVPGGRAARPGMGGRRQKHQPARPFGMGEREGRRHRAAEGMADDDRLADAEMVHQRGDRLCLAVRRLVVAGPRSDQPWPGGRGTAARRGPRAAACSGTIWSFRLALAPWMKTIGGRSGFAGAGTWT